MSSTATYGVLGMTCGHCVSSVTQAVKEADAAARCEIDLGTKRVRITSDQPADAFRSAIEEAGYFVTPEECLTRRRHLAPSQAGRPVWQIA